MNFINVKPELLDASYWLIATTFKFELTHPTSSVGGLDLFNVKSTKIVHVKEVLSLTKPITIAGNKTSAIESNVESIICDTKSESFRTSDLFTSQEDSVQSDAAKYMQRIVGALSTIESATLNASQTTGEGTDTSVFSNEEKQARERLEKATRRLKKLFAKITSVEAEPEFTAAYLEKDIPTEAAAYMAQNSMEF